MTSEQRPIATAEPLPSLATDSVFIAVLRVIANAPFNVLSAAAHSGLVTCIGQLAVSQQIRVAGVALVVAVLTHVAVTAHVGTPVYVAGWSFRVGLVMIGVTAVVWPAELTSAWKGRTTRPR